MDPDPPTTRGEAEAVARLGEEEGWTSVVVVTSDYHARRAGHLLRQCLDADVAVVHIDHARAFATDVGRVIREVGGLLDAWVRPACRDR
ncbi:hypothetical protein BH23ACT9_BH23ACT9_21820 [soil metagenome]